MLSDNLKYSSMSSICFCTLVLTYRQLRGLKELGVLDWNYAQLQLPVLYITEVYFFDLPGNLVQPKVQCLMFVLLAYLLLARFYSESISTRLLLRRVETLPLKVSHRASTGVAGQSLGRKLKLKKPMTMNRTQPCFDKVQWHKMETENYCQR